MSKTVKITLTIFLIIFVICGVIAGLTLGGSGVYKGTKTAGGNRI